MTVADIPTGFDTLAASRARPAAKADIDNVGARMDRRFAEFERRMLKVAIFIAPAQSALTAGPIFGLLKLLGVAP